ncbi:MAG: PEP-utilizing enzyme [Patescibacteria group bacterium]
MFKSVKNRYRLLVDPDQDLCRWKVDAYPALLYAACRDMYKSPYGWPKSEGFFFGHDFYWYDNWSDIWRNGNRYIKKYLQDSRGELPASYMRKHVAAFVSLSHQIKDTAKMSFNKLKINDLRREWFKFFKIYSHFWLVVTDIEVLSYAASHRLSQLLEKSKISISPNEVSILNALPQRSYILEEEYKLLKIAILKKKGEREKRLRQHAKNFSWILNGYHGVRLADETYFRRRLQEFIRRGDSQKRFNELKNYCSNTSRSFKDLVKKYGLDAEIIKYAKLSQRSSLIQDRRKALSWQATEQIIRMYKALAALLGISLEQSLYILWDEFDKAYQERASLLPEITRRQHSCRLRIRSNRTTISTADAKKIFSIFEKEYSQDKGGAVNGIVAYAGKVTGRVRIIRNGRQINNFPAGYILVALMTSPDYIIAIKKAKALVTDDGGLTCHAAIVARELKKPCIVGTRNATRALKNGDLVEVDAHRGLVRKLR